MPVGGHRVAVGDHQEQRAPGLPGVGDLRRLGQPGEQVGLADGEGVMHRQVAEDVPDDLQVLGVDHDRLGAVVAGDDAQQVELDRDAIEERLHHDRRRASSGSGRRWARRPSAACSARRRARSGRAGAGCRGSSRATWTLGRQLEQGSRAPSPGRRGAATRRTGASRAQAAAADRPEGQPGQPPATRGRGGPRRPPPGSPRPRRPARHESPWRVPQAEQGAARQAEQRQARDAGRHEVVQQSPTRSSPAWSRASRRSARRRP